MSELNRRRAYIEQHLREHGFEVWDEQGLAYMVLDMHGGFVFCPYCAEPFPRQASDPAQLSAFPTVHKLKIEP